MEDKTIVKIIISYLATLCAFVVLLILVNIYLITDNSMIMTIVSFLNANLGLIILMCLLFMVAEVLYTFAIPISVPAPVFSAIGSLLIINFLFKVLELLDVLIGTTIFSSLSWLKGIIYSVIFVMVIISGYFSIWTGQFVIQPQKPQEKIQEKIIDIIPKEKTWSDVGSEIKNLAYDSVTTLRKKVNKTDKLQTNNNSNNNNSNKNNDDNKTKEKISPDKSKQKNRKKK